MRLHLSRRYYSFSRDPRFGKVVLLAGAFGLPVATGLGVFCFIRRHHHKMNSVKELGIKDPEFSGFRLLVCKPPYIENAEMKQYFLLPDEIARGAEEARHALRDRLHPEDVIVASYPKSGTTWLSELVYLLVTNLNWSAAAAHNLEERVPYLEYVWPGPISVARRAVPRIIKTHLPFTFLPEEVQLGKAARLIYIVRDPRDVAVSYYHFARCFIPAGYRNKEGFQGFVERFLQDKLPYSPWTEHVKGYLMAAATRSAKVSPRVLIVRYEELKCDPVKTVRKIEEFLHQTKNPNSTSPARKLTDSEITQVVQHCSFESMSKNPSTNFSWLQELGLWTPYTKFMRRGRIGDHQTSMRPKQAELIKERALAEGLGWTLKEVVTSSS
ncbi:Sulfotransferase 1E1 [Clonorchis sinensis]|uniref:Sulfotransferase 1E1 n=1 Tax=Clonorchis sinensis TaxID=79923 RepID=A0A419Q559_CLOSI|nr:Sulfotransferase 1E1 [Clonorchis sinensis]